MDKELKEKYRKTKKLEELYGKLRRELVEYRISDLVDTEKENIKYNPEYQRHYIWNTTKATNLIETVLINGLIPPITIVKDNEKMEIIDRKAEIWNIT